MLRQGLKEACLSVPLCPWGASLTLGCPGGVCLFHILLLLSCTKNSKSGACFPQVWLPQCCPVLVVCPLLGSGSEPTGKVLLLPGTCWPEPHLALPTPAGVERTEPHPPPHVHTHTHHTSCACPSRFRHPRSLFNVRFFTIDLISGTIRFMAPASYEITQMLLLCFSLGQ